MSALWSALRGKELLVLGAASLPVATSTCNPHHADAGRHVLVVPLRLDLDVLMADTNDKYCFMD